MVLSGDSSCYPQVIPKDEEYLSKRISLILRINYEVTEAHK
jgi:hypothetical protein